MKPILSVIVIGRNEALHIERCLQSVLTATRSLVNPEIIYVDSASTDDTIARVRRFPVRVLQLKPDWPLSAAAGRYIGYLHVTGTYLFFIDGDTVLYKHWLQKGIHYLETHEEVAGVAGLMHEIQEDGSGVVLGLEKNRYAQGPAPMQVKTFGGIALYKRKVMEKTGPFNPYIPVDEERELALRIRQAGFRLVRIPDPMAITYGLSRETLPEIMRRGKTRLYHYGVTLRYCRMNGMGRQYVSERLGFVVQFLIAVPVASGVLAGLLFAGLFMYGLGFAGICLILFVLMKRGSFKTIVTSLVKRFLMSWQTIRSYLIFQARPVPTYPTDADVIQ